MKTNNKKPDKQTILNIKKLKSGYKDMEILHGVDMKLEKGGIVAIVGPNGSGKSTVLKSIFNLCNVYSGQILLNGESITRMKTHKVIGKGISYVPQGRQVFHDMTVQENLEMGAYIFKDKKLVESRLSSVYKQFPVLKEKMHHDASSLSGGQQQMLAIGRALMQNPEVLLLDEPSLGLSPKMMKTVFKKVMDINKEGVSIIIVEQNAKQAIEMADRTYILEQGRIALEGNKNIKRNKHIREIYFGGEI